MKIQFFKFKNIIRSWSTWVLAVVTVAPVVNDNSAIFTFIPDNYKPLAITVLGILGLLVRAIKQGDELIESKKQ